VTVRAVPAAPATGPDDPGGRRHLVLRRDRHLKWAALDPLEGALMIACGVSIAGFSISVACDIATRTAGAPWLWLQEVTSAFFVWGAFLGLAAATRRHDHLMLSMISGSLHGRTRLVVELFNRAVVLVCALVLVWFGLENFWHGFGSFRMPSLTPLAWWYLAIPVAGTFVALFAIEQIVNGWRNGFEGPPAAAAEEEEDLPP
jgi:TRAP-type C4-dicarboxylate transport system permease small subunit